MTKDELKEKIKVLVKQVYKPKTLTAQDTISLDAPKFPVLEKFPSLKEVIINLLTDQYELFITDIQWVAPKPTTFRVNLRNDQFFFLTKADDSWIAQVEGKKYYLQTLSDRQRAQEAITSILKYGKPEKEEGELGLQPDEIPPPPPEETPPPPPGEEALPPTAPPI